MPTARTCGVGLLLGLLCLRGAALAGPGGVTSAVIRCRGYEVVLPPGPTVPVRMHAPFERTPEASDQTIPSEAKPDWRGVAARREAAGSMTPPSVVQAFAPPPPAAQRERFEEEALEPAPGEGEEDLAEPVAWGWLSETARDLERAARSQERERIEADALPVWMEDPLGLNGGMDAADLGFAPFEGEMGPLLEEPAAPASKPVWSPPEPPASPRFQWSPP
jgi:hypothetical protein